MNYCIIVQTFDQIKFEFFPIMYLPKKANLTQGAHNTPLYHTHVLCLLGGYHTCFLVVNY